MTALQFKVGDKVRYRNSGFGWDVGVIVEAEHDIKNGRPGYGIDIAEGPNAGGWWGYADQFKPL